MKLLTEILTIFVMMVIFLIGVAGIAALVIGVNTATSQEVEL